MQRPWGWYETLARGPGHLIKRIRIQAGCRLSLQRHRHRSERWVVTAGEGLLLVEGETLPARVGTTVLVPCGSVHRATAGGSDLEILEVQFGEDLREDDIERLADDYGRPIDPVAATAPPAPPPAGSGGFAAPNRTKC